MVQCAIVVDGGIIWLTSFRPSGYQSHCRDAAPLLVNGGVGSIAKLVFSRVCERRFPLNCRQVAEKNGRHRPPIWAATGAMSIFCP